VTLNKAASIELWYKRIAKISVGAVLFLILVGGIVRSTGSGMGCPDWPKCFGLMVPPTKVEDIPPSFFETHPQYESKTFNVFQTWTEYVNRLVGATIGLLMFATAALSFAFWKKDRRIIVLSILAMLLTGFEAWLGKLVVDKNLAGGMVTIHMLVAMIIVAMLVTANYLVAARSQKTRGNAAGTSGLAWLGLLVLLLTVAQILIGTQVRETVDAAAAHLGTMKRDGWLQPSTYYSLHKVIWIVVAGLTAWWVKQVLQQLQGNRTVKLFAVGLVAFIGVEIVLGVTLAYMDLPAFAQPLHMLMANLIFAAEFSILIHVLGVERLLIKRSSNETLLNGAVVNAEQ
jgi:heme a synthase